MSHIQGTILAMTVLISTPALAESNIHTDHKNAWGENIGWTNWRHDTPQPGEGIVYHPAYFEGFVWGENVGWINCGDGVPEDCFQYVNESGQDFGVNVDMNSGNLSGLAWGENIGWINFGWADGNDSGYPQFDGCRFTGYAWGENVGWINLDDAMHYVAVAPTFVSCVKCVSAEEWIWDGYIDPRRESDNGLDLNQGLDSLTVRFTVPIENDDGAPLSSDRFELSDTGGAPPTIVGISTDDGRMVTIELDKIISVGQWTTISVSDVRSTCDEAIFEASVTIGFLPGDIDQNGCVEPFDLLRFREYALGLDLPKCGAIEDVIDTDRSGGVAPFDLLAYRQLINGLAPATQTWAGVCLPPQP